MFRDGGGFKPKTKTINLLLLDGGLGDHIGSLVAVDYIIKNYPWVRPLIWLPDYLVQFAEHVLPGQSEVRGFTEMKGRYEPKRPTKTTSWDGNTSPMKIHTVDYAFLKLCDEKPSLVDKNYLQINTKLIEKNNKFTLPDKYVIFTIGYTAAVREFLPEHINTIAAYVKDKGYTPVFLGQKITKTGAAHTIQGNFSQEIDYSVGINLVDQTSLLEAAFIMHNSAAVIGVDNGLLHLAGCTQAPIVGGFTTVSPELRMPVRRNILGWNYYPITPDDSLGCRFCQVKTNFLYGHDYKNCIYSDNLCTKQMTAEKFISRLEWILI